MLHFLVLSLTQIQYLPRLIYNLKQFDIVPITYFVLCLGVSHLAFRIKCKELEDFKFYFQNVIKETKPKQPIIKKI